MEIKVDEIKDKKLFIATPMYGGMASGIFTKSTNDLALLAGKYGIHISFYFIFNESLIQRARNYCVDEFLRSDCDYMMFIDGDIGFDARHVIALMYMMATDDQYKILTGPYPKKTIAWEKIKKAVDMGYADEHPSNLENVVGDYVFNPIAGSGSFKLSEPIQVQEAGTGFMMIDREVFKTYDEHFPELRYKPDHVRTEHFSGDREITAYFDCAIDPETKRYLSEDYFFCYNSRKIGYSIWMAPWIQLKHMGSYVFGGSLQAISHIGASPTASTESRHKSKISKDNMQNRKQRRAKKKGK